MDCLIRRPSAAVATRIPPSSGEWEFAGPAPHPPTRALVPPGGEAWDLLHPRLNMGPASGVLSSTMGGIICPGCRWITANLVRTVLDPVGRRDDVEVRLPPGRESPPPGQYMRDGGSTPWRIGTGHTRQEDPSGPHAHRQTQWCVREIQADVGIGMPCAAANRG